MDSELFVFIHSIHSALPSIICWWVICHYVNAIAKVLSVNNNANEYDISIIIICPPLAAEFSKCCSLAMHNKKDGCRADKSSLISGCPYLGLARLPRASKSQIRAGIYHILEHQGKLGAQIGQVDNLYWVNPSISTSNLNPRVTFLCSLGILKVSFGYVFLNNLLSQMD